jgi:hypothetical protein
MASQTAPIAEQLRGAWIASGLTLSALRERARIQCTADSLSRKLAGKQALWTTEAEALADALTFTLVWAPGARRRCA